MRTNLARNLAAFALEAASTLGPGCNQPAAPESKVPDVARESADSGLFCKEHGVPEKFCTICHPELKDKLLLCKEHGDIPEDICTLCHPEVEQEHSIEMCPNGHKLPKHFCAECAKNPAA